MFSSESSQLIDEIDRILEGEQLDEEVADELCELLSPGGNGVGFDVRAVLHLCEHPVVASAAEDQELPPDLREAIAEAVGAVSAMLGEWSGAPLAVQAGRLRRRFDKERKKYEMVRDRLQQEGLEEGSSILRRYIDTSPAPMFSEQLAADFDDMYQKARDDHGSGRAKLVADERLTELLRFDESTDDQSDEFDELVERLRDVAADIGDLEGVVDRALVEGDVQAQLVAGAIAVDRGWNDQAHGMLMRVVRGRRHAPQMAAFSAWMAPSVARHVLGRFLVDILNDGTPTEDLDADQEDVRRAIVAARTVLPLIGSPLDEIDQIEAEAEETADRVRRAWALCERLDGGDEDGS